MRLGASSKLLWLRTTKEPPYRSTIVERKPRFFTPGGFGSGMGVFQTFDHQRVPAVPIFGNGFVSGDIAAWGSGVGPSGNRSDNSPSPVENFAETAMVEAYVGGVPVERIFYVGPTRTSRPSISGMYFLGVRRRRGALCRSTPHSKAC